MGGFSFSSVAADLVDWREVLPIALRFWTSVLPGGVTGVDNISVALIVLLAEALGSQRDQTSGGSNSALGGCSQTSIS